MTLATVAAASGEEIVPFDSTRAEKPVFRALTEARSQYGGKKPAIVDGDERVLTYDEVVRASFALGHALKKGTRPGESVGIMLPSGAGAVISFFAISAYGRVPAMLNFTSGAAGLKSAIRTAQIGRPAGEERGAPFELAEPLSASCEALVAAREDVVKVCGTTRFDLGLMRPGGPVKVRTTPPIGFSETSSRWPR